MPTIRWTDEELNSAGIDRKRLEHLVRSLRKASKELTAMGLTVYGSDGTGYLIHRSRPEHDDQMNMIENAIVADVGFGFDGGGW